MGLLLLKAAALDPRFKLTATRDLVQYVSACIHGDAMQHMATASSSANMVVAEEVAETSSEPVPST